MCAGGKTHRSVKMYENHRKAFEFSSGCAFCSVPCSIEVALWLHESERIYGDRLVSVADLKRYKAISADMAKKMFGKFNFGKYFQEKNPEILVFAPFSKGHTEDPCYDQIKGTDSLLALLTAALNDYNETNAAMDLVFFEDAMKHISRVARIISNSSGLGILEDHIGFRSEADSAVSKSTLSTECSMHSAGHNFP